MNKKWFQFDLARFRSFDRAETEELIKVLSKCGYNGIGLYIEGFFEFPNFKGAPRRGCMTKADAKWVCEIAKQYNLEVMPLTNLVGHGESFFCQERFTPLGKDDYQFDMKKAGFYDFAKSVIDQFIECFNPKMLHIGGDEVNLGEEDRKDYVRFLSDMCLYLKEKGIETGIWGDMFIKHPEMAADMNKDVHIFDWWYYGHRPQSTKMLKSAGFKNIVVCPSTQSWDAIVGSQQICPWREVYDWKVPCDIAADEVEAFLTDGQEQGVYDALLTDWENYRGHLIWNNMNSVARFGQFVNNKALDDNTLNNVVFGRQTPYMECAHILMDVQKIGYTEYEKLPGRFVNHQHGQDFIFDSLALCKILQCGYLLREDLGSLYIDAAKKVEENLSTWQTKGSLEDRCKRSMQFAAAYAKAVGSVYNMAHRLKETYRNASFQQYENEQKYSQLLRCVKQEFIAFADSYDSFIESLQNAISDSGHTRRDIKELKNTKALIEKMAASLDDYDIGGCEFEEGIALPSFKELLCENLGRVNPSD